MIERIWIEDKPTAWPDAKKSSLFIKFSDGTFVATEIDHSLSKKKLSDEIGKFAAFILLEPKKEQQ